MLTDRLLPETLALIDAFNAGRDGGRAVADAIEMRVDEPGAIDAALDQLPEDLFPYFEFPVRGDCRGFVAALSGEQAGAKIRTGGITPELIPTCGQVAGFITACAHADVRFKATAGLHHPFRSERALDSRPGADGAIPRGVMHGFVNLFMAAAFARSERAGASTLVAVLDDADPAHFRLGEEQAEWRGGGGAALIVDASRLARVRETFALGFGSCSFSEPVDELRALGLI